MGELPATLTEAQLARLDALTREAIDERLRVLEGVSGAVYRCVEELTRVRSVLPPLRAAGAGAGGRRAEVGEGDAGRETTPGVVNGNGNGSGKAVDVGADGDAAESASDGEERTEEEAERESDELEGSFVVR